MRARARVCVSGPISLVRVIPGHIGLATINKNPVILDTGVHFIVRAL